MNTKTIALEDVQASLDTLFALVREGSEVIIMDGDKPLARVSPVEPASVFLICIREPGSVMTSMSRCPMSSGKCPLSLPRSTSKPANPARKLERLACAGAQTQDFRGLQQTSEVHSKVTVSGLSWA